MSFETRVRDHHYRNEPLFVRLLVGQGLYWITGGLIMLLFRSPAAMLHPASLAIAAVVAGLSVWAYPWLMRCFDQANRLIHQWLSWWPRGRR